MIAVWILSVKKKDASLVDRCWGLNFVLITFVYFIVNPALNMRHFLLLALVSIWGIRLSYHIHKRNTGRGEDYRYRSMRKKHGSRFWWYSLFSVFLFQGLLAWVISAPILWVFMSNGKSIFFLDKIAFVVWVLGFFFETMSDYQLAKFKAKTANTGKVCKEGLWALCRHPNYFGDALVWWSFYIFALSVPYGFLSFFGPLIMNLFLRYISGVSLLEQNLKKTKPEYAAYIASTPAFIPNFKYFIKWKC